MRTARIGMGCNRLGSLLAKGGPDAAVRAVQAAVEAGITFFDTANIYGQGSSELILKKALPRGAPVEICSKAGFYTPVPLWALRAVKPVMRRLASLSPKVRDTAAAARKERYERYPQNFDPAYLEGALNACLKRLGRERLEVFLFHNPKPPVEARDEVWRWVDRALASGRIGSFGISCFGLPEEKVWLAHPQVTTVQIPVASVLPEPGDFAADPRAQRLRIIARGAVGQGEHGAAAIKAGLARVLNSERVSIALLGMSTPEHVREVAAFARDIAAERAASV